MRLSYSCSPASSAGSGSTTDSNLSDEYSHCLNQDPVLTQPTVPAKAHVRQFHAENLDFAGSDAEPDITALGTGTAVEVGHSSPRNNVHVLPPAGETDNPKAVKKEQKAKRKPCKGKHRVSLPISNIYISSSAGGRGRAKVGGAGVPVGACILM
ncbi:hypothetical protein FGG08_001024 [Glutinoglossum americanum]|uniref:Uncharacterized protein n=1 Tax=Glutinoglossum americanum TaxID=1670608 RepID=A0A9P8IBR3_9PEZI|nr:hypothetical protein FGG08_001024 [Glutinoglossum americanum]